MSKFTDKLRSLSKSSATPLGFQSRSSEAKSAGMLLVGAVMVTDAKEIDLLAGVGADAGLVVSEGDVSSKRAAEMVKAASGLPLGAYARGVSEKKLGSLGKAGWDFLVFDGEAPAAALELEEQGRFLMIEPGLDQGLVRAVNGLEPDGVFINRTADASLTVQDLVLYRRFVELLESPVIVVAGSGLAPAAVSGLWRAGVQGIVVPPAQPAELWAELRKAVEGLPRSPKRRRARPGVILPRQQVEPDMEVEEEEEEEEI